MQQDQFLCKYLKRGRVHTLACVTNDNVFYRPSFFFSASVLRDSIREILVFSLTLTCGTSFTPTHIIQTLLRHSIVTDCADSRKPDTTPHHTFHFASMAPSPLDQQGPKATYVFAVFVILNKKKDFIAPRTFLLSTNPFNVFNALFCFRGARFNNIIPRNRINQ